MPIRGNNYRETINFLYNLQFFGIKLGLENIRKLMVLLGNPHLQYPVVHIAGTNGKGSTSAMIASILTASGYRTGLYTSPHLIHFEERIRIDGIAISEREVVAYTQYLRAEIEHYKATFFEATTAIAFKYFADQDVDIAIIETGLGGRFDATNVVDPLLTIITSINLDHTEYLGKSLSKIAFEKGGIIKQRVPCILGSVEKEAEDVIAHICSENWSQLISVRRQSKSKITRSTFADSSIDIDARKRYRNVTISLAGNYQAMNAQTAVLATEYLCSVGGLSKISEETVRKGLASIQRYTGIRGRLDIIKQRPLVLGDVAHNPAAVDALCSTLSSFYLEDIILVFGIMKDKDLDPMIPPLSTISRLVVAVEPDTHRARKGSEIVEKFHSFHHKAVFGGNVTQGIELALSEWRERDIILLLGSHYVFGEAMNYFSGE